MCRIIFLYKSYLKIKTLAFAAVLPLCSALNAQADSSFGSILNSAFFQKIQNKDSIESSKTALKNWGLFQENSNSHIHAPSAWRLSQGNRNIVVAVIDTGIDVNHQSLKENIKKDNQKKPLGWDFNKNTVALTDEHGHGTHVAGIVGAVLNLQSGISGVAPQISLMPIKYYSDSNSGSTNLKNTVRAIHYAIDNGAQIINYSGGGPEFSEEEYLAIKRAEAKGILFVAAAGNERQDTDLVENYYYPSAYRLNNIISVAAITPANTLLKSSNWGKNKVDVAAPGENIYSTLPGNRFGNMSGTSQATAFVSGIAALLLSKNPKLTPIQIKQIITQSVDRVSSLEKLTISGGKVNAYQAILALQNLEALNQKPIPSKKVTERSPVNLLRLLSSPNQE